LIEKLLRKGLDEIKPYVPGKGMESVPRGIKGVKLASNENPLGPSKRVLDALKDIDKLSINTYPDSMNRTLQSAISKYVSVNEDSIVVGNGSNVVLDLAIKVFLNKNEKAIIPTPTFSLYEKSVKTYSGNPVYVPQDTDFEYDVGKLVSAIDKETKIVFVCSPNNPTGSVMPQEGLSTLLEEEVVVILDEAYAEYADKSNAKLVKEYDNLVVLRTFSKAFGLAGLRVGYALANKVVAECMSKVMPPFNVNKLAQAAALATLRDVDHLTESISLAKKGRDLLFMELSKIPGIKVYPSQGNFLLVNTPKKPDVASLLLEKGIIVRDCANFRGLSNEYFRVSIGTEAENEKFLKAFREIIY